MVKIDWREFYGEDPIRPIRIEKYFLDDGRMLKTRQMTYEFSAYNLIEVEGVMYPTFEVNDIVTDNYGKGDAYHIFKYERGFREMHVELLDENMELTGKTTYLDNSEVFHKVKGVEWI